jgi:hypothetical protein
MQQVRRREVKPKLRTCFQVSAAPPGSNYKMDLNHPRQAALTTTRCVTSPVAWPALPMLTTIGRRRYFLQPGKVQASIQSTKMPTFPVWPAWRSQPTPLCKTAERTAAAARPPCQPLHCGRHGG